MHPLRTLAGIVAATTAVSLTASLIAVGSPWEQTPVAQAAELTSNAPFYGTVSWTASGSVTRFNTSRSVEETGELVFNKDGTVTGAGVTGQQTQTDTAQCPTTRSTAYKETAAQFGGFQGQGIVVDESGQLAFMSPSYEVSVTSYRDSGNEACPFTPPPPPTAFPKLSTSFPMADQDSDPAWVSGTYSRPISGDGAGSFGTITFTYRIAQNSGPEPTPTKSTRKCQKVAKNKVAYKTVTPLLGPDVHWYTTKITVAQCRKKGKLYITGLSAKRKVEKGFVPRAIGLVGWTSRTDSPTSYSPSTFPSKGTRSASARLQYTACFDLTKLLDKAGLKKHVKNKLKRPLEKVIGKVLKKAKITRIDKRVRNDVAVAWKRKIDQAFKKGTIKTYLNDKYRVPVRIGRAIEKLAASQKSKVKSLLKGKVVQALETGNYDNLTAKAASAAMLKGGFKALDRLVNYCGGGPGLESSWLLTWDVSFDVTGGTRKIKVTPNSYYRHPLMQVRRS